MDSFILGRSRRPFHNVTNPYVDMASVGDCSPLCILYPELKDGCDILQSKILDNAVVI